jgi:hypothetical protein
MLVLLLESSISVDMVLGYEQGVLVDDSERVSG